MCKGASCNILRIQTQRCMIHMIHDATFVQSDNVELTADVYVYLILGMIFFEGDILACANHDWRHDLLPSFLPPSLPPSLPPTLLLEYRPFWTEM